MVYNYFAGARRQVRIGPVIADARHVEPGDDVFLQVFQVAADVDDGADGFRSENDEYIK